MLNQYFGNYLLSNNLVDPHVLMSLLDENKKAHVKLGILAINSNLMTAKQVNEIHEMQKKIDKRFGELAVEKGYLKEADVDFLLGQQRLNSVQLSQLLVDKNIFTLEELENILLAYRKENNVDEMQFKEIEKINSNEVLKSVLKLQGKILQIDDMSVYNDYLTLCLRNFVRFIDHQLFLDDLKDNVLSEKTIAVSQEISGTYNLMSYFIMEEDTFIKVAASYSKMELEKRDELVEASVAEFLNLNNGLFTVNMSEEGKPIMLKPPVIQDKADGLVLDSLILTPVVTNLGRIVIAVKPQ